MTVAALSRPAAALAGLMLLAAPAALAEGPQPFVFDTAHTQILFEVDRFGFSIIQGQFLAFDGTLAIDETAPENSSVSVTIDAASVFSGHQGRDDHLRSADFLDVATYPEITFASREVRMTGESTAEIVGDLTIRGVSQEVVLETTLNRLAPNPFNQRPTAGFTATTAFDRSVHGVAFGLPMLGDTVSVRIFALTMQAE